ncbi:hypothetical protein GGR58DRAFT_25084 [Xylaria digitata]|nr:hypothetical protein GGR58DRAFT_25084 [Xylaria digitata]
MLSLEGAVAVSILRAARSPVSSMNHVIVVRESGREKNLIPSSDPRSVQGLGLRGRRRPLGPFKGAAGTAGTYGLGLGLGRSSLDDASPSEICDSCIVEPDCRRRRSSFGGLSSTSSDCCPWPGLTSWSCSCWRCWGCSLGTLEIPLLKSTVFLRLLSVGRTAIEFRRRLASGALGSPELGLVLLELGGARFVRLQWYSASLSEGPLSSLSVGAGREYLVLSTGEKRAPL